MKITIVKQLDNSFKAAYDSDFDKLRKIKAGDMVECEIKKPRNYKFHKKFFALINLVYQNQDHYQNIDHLRTDLTIAAGHFDKRVSVHGEEVVEAKSISFASMDEETFGQLYSSVVDAIVKYFHFEREDILENVEQFF